MRLRPAAIAACAFSSVLASARVANAEAVWLTNNLTLSLQQSPRAGGLHPHPNVIHFIGAARVDIVSTPSAAGTHTNPMFQAKGVSGTNPVHVDRPGPPGQLEPVEFVSMSFELTTLDAVVGNGVVHRDIAARNFLLITTAGTYASLPSESLTFSSVAGMDFEQAAQSGLTWTQDNPFLMRLYSTTEDLSDDWIEIGADAAFETTIVPAPGAVSLIPIAGIACLRRRRG